MHYHIHATLFLDEIERKSPVFITLDEMLQTSVLKENLQHVVFQTNRVKLLRVLIIAQVLHMGEVEWITDRISAHLLWLKAQNRIKKQ